MRALVRLSGTRCRHVASGRQPEVVWQTTNAFSTAQDVFAKPASAIPGPKSRLIVGTTPLYRPGGEFHHENSLKLGMYMYRKYGPIVREKMMPGFTFVHLFHAEDIEKVYRNEGKHPWRIPTDFTVQYRKKKGVSAGLAHVQGEEWLRIRGQVQTQMLRLRSVSAYLPEQGIIGDDLVTRARKLRDSNNDVDQFDGELNKWSMESIGLVCFNTRVGALEPDLTCSKEAQDFIDATSGTFEHTSTLFNSLPLYKIFPTKAYKEFSKCMDVIWNLTRKHIALTEDRAARGELGGVTGDDNMLLFLMNQPKVSRDEAYVLLTDLFFAGVETTAHTLSFCLYHIASNPHVQKKLQQEIDEKLPRGVPLTEKAFDHMSYLKAVVRESARVSPVIQGNIRKLDKDLEIQGYNIPAGEIFLMWSGVAGLLPRYYDNPEEFQPERWMRGSKSRDANPFTVLPFGFGPRMCLGRRFAEQEIYIGITKLLQNFNLEYHGDTFGIQTKVINMPAKPLKLRLIDRA